MTTIASRLQATRASIQAAVTNAGRQPDEVALLAVSKQQPGLVLRSAYAAGQRLFGENYVQEALDKQEELADLDIEWHFIGPIQSNKTQLIAPHFSWVHGVDRLKVAQRLNDSRPWALAPLQVCIQVNISQETSKSGVMPDQAARLAEAIMGLPQLQLRGLMAIPMPTPDKELQRQQFKLLRTIFNQLNASGHRLDTLSMGMSDDFAIAIEEGATIVRIGSAIFGERRKPG